MAGKKDKDEAVKKDPLSIAIAELEKEYGKGTILSGRCNFPDINRIPSGSIALDRALGGGYPLGRMIEIIGAESAGKTTITLHAIAEAQKQGLRAAFVDLEHSLDLGYASNLGVNADELLIAQPSTGEEAFNIAEKLIRSGVVKLIVMDSVSALLPRVELEKDIGESSVGRQAGLMSQAMRKLTGPCSEQGASIYFVNQIRMKIGVFFGSPDTTSGGQALKYYASQRLDIRRIETIEQGENKTGIRAQVKVIKNKVGPPFKLAQFNIMFGTGIDKEFELLEMAIEADIVQKEGSWYKYQGNNIAQGANNVAEHLRNDPVLADELREKLNGEIEGDNSNEIPALICEQ